MTAQQLERRELLEIPLEQLTPAGDNVRRELGGLDTLVASIADVGIIEPIVVTWAGDENWKIVAGHRRVEAARKAGLASVPCVERAELADVERVKLMLVENLVRRDLDPIEEAHAFQRLLELGVSQRKLADELKVCSQSHISKRLSLLKLPQAALDAVDSGGISLDQAVKLAPLPTAKVEALFKGGQRPSSYDVDHAVREHEIQAKRAAARKKLAADGIAVVDKEPGPRWKHRLGEPGDYGLGITDEQHRAEPCHVAMINFAGGVDYYCTDPTRHDSDGASTVKVPVVEPAKANANQSLGARRAAAKKETPEQRAERERVDAQRKELVIAGETRRRFVGDLLAKAPPATFVEFSTGMLVRMQADPYSADAAQLLGHDPSNFNAWDWGTDKLVELVDESPKSAARVLYALGFAAGESLVHEAVSDYRGPAQFSDDDLPTAQSYFAHLIDQGYEPTAVERWLLGDEPGVADEASDEHDYRIVPVGKTGKKFKLVCACGLEAQQTSTELCEQRHAEHLRQAKAAS